MTTSDASKACSALVVALVEWGATASQVVAHMERTRRATSSTAEPSTVQAFQRVISEVAARAAAGQPSDEIRRAAGLVAAIDQAVRNEIVLVPLAATACTGAGRRGAHD